MRATNKILIFWSIILFLNNIAKGQNTPLPSSILNTERFQWGYLDVTALGIDNTGTVDVTDAINEAIVMARDNQLVCYFPSGTYLISDTIKAMLLSYDHNNNPNDPYFSDRRFPCVLEGECTNRPVLKLKDGAPGFNTPTEGGSKAAVMIWAAPRVDQTITKNGNTIQYPKGSTDPEAEFPGIAFNQIFRNFVIDLGNNNPGAVGVRFSGAQGASMENVKIIATGAYAGLHRTMGQASGYYNIEIIGGRYGIQINDPRLSEYAFMSGVRFINQTQYAIWGLAWFPINITGFYIESPHGRVFNNHPATRGGIALIDGVINATGTPNEAVFKTYSKRNIYLKNVDIKGNGRIIDVVNNPSESITANANSWTKFVELSYCPDGQNRWKNLTECTIDQQDFNTSFTVNQPLDTTEIFNKHIGPIKDCFDIESAINVKDASDMNGNPALGDGDNNDTPALQWALNNTDNYNVFLPKGEYKIDTTLLLKYHTNLYGVGKVFSRIKAAPGWNNADQPIIRTINNPDANTRLTNVMIEIDPEENHNLTALHWQAGRNSVVNNIMLGVDGFSTEQTPLSSIHYGFQINGSGGGRWYNTCAEWQKLRYTTRHPAYRFLLVENTTEPLSFYSLNVERVRTEPQTEIKNAANVDIYYFKAEAGGDAGLGSSQPYSIPLKINDSNNLNIYSGTGKVEVDSLEAFVEIYNSYNTSAVHLKSIKDTVKRTIDNNGNPTIIQYFCKTLKTDCNELSSQVHLARYSSCRNIIYVNQNATGNNSGLNWADAYTNLHDALNNNNSSYNGTSQVWVAQGTYYTSNQATDRNSSFNLLDGFYLYGGFKGYESHLYERDFVNQPTILSGEIGTSMFTDNAYHIIKADGINSETCLDGFTIEKGYADGPGTDNRGGGIFITINNTGTVYFENNIIQNNYAKQGGALYNSSKAILTNNELRFNEAAINGSSIYNWGNNSNLRLESGNEVHNQICNTCFNYLYTDVLGNLHIGEDNSIRD